MTETPAHLMLIDGDPARRDLFRTYLKRQGFLVSAARDTDHARRLLAGLDFDLIVMDDSQQDESLCDLTKARFCGWSVPGPPRPAKRCKNRLNLRR